MRVNSWRGRWGAAVPLLAATMAAHAGGHFEVDDAGTLASGECQAELWASHGQKSNVNLYHVGPSCGVGGVELGLNWDQTRGIRTITLGPQVKWTFFGREAESPLSAALSAGTQYDLRNDGQWGGQGLLAVSWQALPPVQVNANLGTDWVTVSGERTGRGGLQVQWAVRPDFTLVAERNKSFTQWGSRLGFSWQVLPQTSIDFSVARLGLLGGETAYTVGLNQVFDFRARR